MHPFNSLLVSLTHSTFKRTHANLLSRLRLKDGAFIDSTNQEHGHSLRSNLRLYPVLAHYPPGEIETRLFLDLHVSTPTRGSTCMWTHLANGTCFFGFFRVDLASWKTPPRVALPPSHHEDLRVSIISQTSTRNDQPCRRLC